MATRPRNILQLSSALTNDLLNPGANKVYGTDANGVKGWKDDPSGGGSFDFLGLTDTPDTYSAQGGNYLAVKSDESGVEFVTAPFWKTTGTTTLTSDVTIAGSTSRTLSFAPSVVIGTRVSIRGQYAFSVGSFVAASGNNSVAFGNESSAAGNNSLAIGSFTYAAQAQNFAGGTGTITKPIISDGAGSFNYSTNDAAQISNGGAHAARSAILGGLNHNIASGSDGAVILGGNAINVPSGKSNYTHVQSLSIGGGKSGVITTEWWNGFNSFLTWNPTAVRNISLPDASGSLALFQSGDAVVSRVPIVVSSTGAMSSTASFTFVSNLLTVPRISLSANTTSAGTAPIKLAGGTAMTTPEDGAIEYHNNHLYFTIGSTRYQLDQQSSTAAIIESVSTTTYNFTEADNGKIKRFTNAAGCTATVPTGLSSGWNCVAYRADGAGTTTIASSGTIEGIGTTLETDSTACTIIHRGSDIHVLLGALGSGGGGGITNSANSGEIAISNGTNIIGDSLFKWDSTGKALVIANGTPPGASVTNGFQLYSADIIAGNAAPHFRTEGGAVVKLYQVNTGSPYTISNDTPNRTLDVSSYTMNDLANFVATIAKDIKLLNIFA